MQLNIHYYLQVPILGEYLSIIIHHLNGSIHVAKGRNTYRLVIMGGTHTIKCKINIYSTTTGKLVSTYYLTNDNTEIK